MSKLNKLLLTKSQGYEDSAAVFMALIRGSDRDLILQADLSSITYSVTDLSDDSNPVTADTLTVANVILDTPVTDDIAWLEKFPGDTIGYNFIFEAPKTWFPAGGKTYRVEFIFQPTTGANYEFVVAFEHKTTAIKYSP